MLANEPLKVAHYPQAVPSIRLLSRATWAYY